MGGKVSSATTRPFLSIVLGFKQAGNSHAKAARRDDSMIDLSVLDVCKDEIMSK